MPWQVQRKLVERNDSSMTFALTLRENGVRRGALRLTVDSGLGSRGIKAELKRAALQRVKAIVAARATI